METDNVTSRNNFNEVREDRDLLRTLLRDTLRERDMLREKVNEKDKVITTYQVICMILALVLFWKCYILH